MTEDLIERRLERAMDRLDANFMAGAMSQEEYDAAVAALEQQRIRELSRLHPNIPSWLL